MNKNSNVFTGERGYKTNFFLKFKSERIEDKFLEDTFIRNRFTIQGFLFFSLLLLFLHYMLSDCYIVNSYCNHEILLISCLICHIAGFICLHFRLFHNSVRITMLLASIYVHILILDKYSSDISLVLITLYTSIASKAYFY